MNIPDFHEKLTEENKNLLKAMSTRSRQSIIAMLGNSQSGHPGGSLSSIDYLTILYAFIIAKTGNPIVVSHGHISPAVYSILSEMGWIDRNEVIEKFRKFGSKFEGHITRHVPGVWYGTGPLGVGGSVASGIAYAKSLRGESDKVYLLMGDGELEEGQFYEMINFANKYKQSNLILFVDANKVQLTGSLDEIMPLNIPEILKAAGWNVIESDGHDYDELWDSLSQAQNIDTPVAIIGHTIMGKGVSTMEPDGQAMKSTWHGKAPNPTIAQEIVEELQITKAQQEMLKDFQINNVLCNPKPEFKTALSPLDIKAGNPIIYDNETLTDNRSAYGKALLDLAKANKEILALTADLGGSVMTKFVRQELPDQHIEVGIEEQHMVSLSGGLSTMGYIPFCSTFGAFLSSRAKDQARVNDINQTNVKMVATHSGLSVGEDGPTHQAIDDMGSFLGMFNTHIIEPADPNQTDRIIRYIATHYGNFYVRMGRHKYPVLTTEDGSIFFDKEYRYTYGRMDLLRTGSDVTVVCSGATCYEAQKAWEDLKMTKPNISVEILIASSIKQFDHLLIDSVEKTKNVITVEDHNPYSGLGAQVSRSLMKNGVSVKSFNMLGVTEYELSGKASELYAHAGIDEKGIKKTIENLK